MKKRGIVLGLLCSAVLSILVPFSALAAEAVSAEPKANSEAKNRAETTKVKEKWVRKGKKYFWRQSDGTLLKKSGMRKLKGSYYFLAKDSSRAAGIHKSGGSWYYFQSSDGKRFENTGWKTIGGKKYYVTSDASLATGACKIKKKTYFFTKKGVLKTNRRTFAYRGKYYRTDKNGVMIKLTKMKAKASIATWKFINKHSSKKQSKAKRFRACFNWLEAYMEFKYAPFRKSNYASRDWPYRYVVKCLKNNTGDCMGFACIVASVAKELGYEPYVIVMTCDHAVVQIDGKYYDNMGGGLFGSSSPYIKDYKIYKKAKF